MALSTSDLVADNLSASSVGGASGSRLALASLSGPGVGAWLAEAWLATSPDSVRRALFLLEESRALIYLPGVFPLKDNGAPYLCGDVSIRAALLFRLLGRTDLVRSVAAGSASRCKGTPCQTPLVHDGQK